MMRRAGSSPLTRGKPDLQVPHTYRAGLIPAHAGKTPRTRRACNASGAHPRSRGENRGREPRDVVGAGSSPLTRGKLGDSGIFISWTGLIPAHAGKTPDRNRPARHDRAHPRSRGENVEGTADLLEAEGSSPLTRGKLTDAAPPTESRRLIPAHAGKTRSVSPKTNTRKAHPRSRGENGS